MIPRPAQYLIRFDDLCPTLPRARWQEFRTVLEEFRISPILAVIPDNRDTSLDRSPSDPAFWDEMRAMEAAGATIAVHGYQHLCSSRGESLLGIHRRSEFAGVDFEIQREWIRMGLQILRDKGLNPRLWVAPRHGFDRNTLDALSNEGIEYISDGFARVPYYQDGVTWIPQQLWSPLTKSKGLWTICIHPYASRASEVDRLRSFLNAYGPQFTSFDRVLKELDPRVLGLSERVYQRLALWRVQRHHKRSRQRRRRS